MPIQDHAHLGGPRQLARRSRRGRDARLHDIHFLIAAPSTEKNASEALQLPVRRVRYVSLLRTLGDDSFV